MVEEQQKRVLIYYGETSSAVNESSIRDTDNAADNVSAGERGDLNSDEEQRGGNSKENKETSAEVVQLQHPRTGAATCFLVVGGRSIQELNWYKQRLSSWFIGNSVCQDGSLYLASPIDPIFLLLPLLDTARFMDSRGDRRKGGESEEGVFRSLSDILFVQGFPTYQALEHLWIPHLKLVCQVRDAGGSTYYRLDQQKILRWLKLKALRTADAVKAHGGTHYADQQDSIILQYALGLLLEYLPKGHWPKRLCSIFKLSEDDISAATVMQRPKSGQEAAGDEANKWERIGGVPELPASFTSPAPQTEPQRKGVQGGSGSVSAKRKAAAAANTSKITSFFSRPR